jgi:hypothetical protein
MNELIHITYYLYLVMMVHYTMELVNAIGPLLRDKGSMSNYLINKTCKYAINKFRLKTKN